jgi:hypothetical protein
LLAWIVALGRVPQGAATGLAGWRAALTQLLSAQTGALDQLSAAQKEILAAKQDEKRAQLRYQAARRLRPRRESTIDLQVEVPQTTVVTVLTAPWSGLLVNLAKALGGSLSVGAMRALGVALTVAAALLNARVFYGIVARMERDAKGAARSRPSH